MGNENRKTRSPWRNMNPTSHRCGWNLAEEDETGERPPVESGLDIG